MGAYVEELTSDPDDETI
jgi:hypothetical protein